MKAKHVFIIIGCILVAVFLSTMIGFATNGHDRNEDNWGITQVNKDNFFKSADYTIMTKNTGDGYNVTVSDKGEIKVTGKNESGTLAKLEVQRLTLPAGTYTFTSGASGTSKSGYHMYLTDGTNTIYADFDQNTFTVSAEASYTAYISIADECEISSTFKPVLVKGEEEGSFYVSK